LGVQPPVAKSPAGYQEMKMMLALLFVRKRSRRKPRRPAHMDLVNNWTTRDWADLPHHHPKHD